MISRHRRQTWVTRMSGCPSSPGKRARRNIAAMTSAGREEIGESVLRRCLSARMDSSNELISASIVCCWYCQELLGARFIVKTEYGEENTVNYFIPTPWPAKSAAPERPQRSTHSTQTSTHVASTLRLRPSPCLSQPIPFPRQDQSRQAPSYIWRLPRRRPRKWNFSLSSYPITPIQFSLGIWTFLDAAILSAHAHPPLNEPDYPLPVHVTFADWVPGLCSLLGILVVNLIDKDRVRGDEGFGDSRAVWRARLFLFVGFALMAGGLAGSVVCRLPITIHHEL